MMTEDQKARLGITEAVPWKLHTILLVEPDAAIREPLHTALTAAGYQTLTPPTGEAALTAIEQRRAQLVTVLRAVVRVEAEEAERRGLRRGAARRSGPGRRLRRAPRRERRSGRWC